MNAVAAVGQTVDAALMQARRLGLERLDAQLLLAHLLQCPRAWLLAHGDAALPPPVRERFGALCASRTDGVPLAYLVGEREFHGLMLNVTPDVLDPRPDTETLVDWGLRLLATRGPGRVQVADLGTGSGAIALAVKSRWPSAEVVAVDRDAAALAVAAGNARRHGLQVEFRLGDWWLPLAGQRFDLVLANPPYVADGDPHLQALRHEPRSALVAGADGLADIERIVRGARDHLHPGGWLLLEHGCEQAAATRERLAAAGFTELQTHDDLAVRPRCSGGRLGDE